ncbi:MAG: helicase-related protein, partial [Gordonia sp. (in: high G+C Gram-positive bacteria)]|uniref:helicase-related protein n=1 Tax=Gordonia sp. (in: high G+C Gram-positive bacteria) TaxID=84139 RepID=UPI003BB79116
AKERVRSEVEPLIATADQSGQASSAWYVLAPALLDGEVYEAQYSYEAPPLSDDDDSDERENLSNRDKHLEYLSSLLEDDASRPPVPKDLFEVLALAGIASPAAVILRTMRRRFPTAAPELVIGLAQYASEGFRHLFNLPHGSQVISTFQPAHDGKEDFWHKALVYCATGNLQSVMDEYVEVMVEHKGYDRLPCDEAADKTAETIRDVLGLRIPTYRPSTIVSDEAGQPLWDQVSMRGGFALRLVSDGTQSEGARDSNAVSTAFNSPFWPFVLASTSVGQEGLDFHLYSHAVSHWNLPTNPVDLEQREGRVHRYKCHAVRKNVARSVGFPAGAENIWEELFARAKARKLAGSSDIVPYWVFAPSELGDETAQVERHLHITPYTRERALQGNLLASVSLYRMAFGQPRQDELLKYVLRDADEELREKLTELRIDLTPRPRTLSRSSWHVPREVVQGVLESRLPW